MIDEDKFFYFEHGETASSIEEMYNIFQHLGDTEFNHHVTSDRNDYANWIEYVFHEHELAHQIRENSSKENVMRVLEVFLSIKPAEPISNKQKPQIMTEHVTDHMIEHVDAVESVKPEEEVSFHVDEPPEIGNEHELSEDELKEVLDDTKKLIEEESEELKESEELEVEHAIIPEPGDRHKIRIIQEKHEQKEPAVKSSHKFILKEFIYGFLFGILFALFILGMLKNVGCA